MKTLQKLTLNTREGKIALLKNIEQGKAGVASLIQPVFGVIYIKDGNVYCHGTNSGDMDINPPMEEAEYRRQNAGRFTHVIVIQDFSEGNSSKPIEKNSQIQ